MDNEIRDSKTYNEETVFDALEEEEDRKEVRHRSSRRSGRRTADPETRRRAQRLKKLKARQEGRHGADMKPQAILALILLLVFVLGFGSGLAGSRLLAGRKKTGSDSLQASSVTKEQERLEGIKWAFTVGSGILETLRKYYPDDIVMVKNNKYVFEPIDRSLKMHDFDPEKVRKNVDGTWGYVDGDRKVMKGIDVSSHQGEIDWGKVAFTNVEFAMIRAMYRGYESGKLVEDKQFRYNIEGAREKGIKTGVYVFTQALTNKEVDEEVNMLCGLLGPYDLDLPVVVDVEAVGDDEARMDVLTKEERTAIVKYYCEKLEKAGYRPMIYFNIDGAVNLVDVSQLEDYDKWFAVYDSNFYYPYAYQMWQYKDKGRVDGITGNVDLDLYFPE